MWNSIVHVMASNAILCQTALKNGGKLLGEGLGSKSLKPKTFVFRTGVPHLKRSPECSEAQE